MSKPSHPTYAQAQYIEYTVVINSAMRSWLNMNANPEFETMLNPSSLTI